MKRPLTIVALMAATTAALAQIDVREVTFPADEIPATNPRVVKIGTTYTHIEVFGAFDEQEDGSVKTLVAETSINMDSVSAAAWIKDAKTAVGAASPRRWSRLSIKTALAKANMLSAARTFLSGVEIATGYTAWEALTDCDYIEEGYPDPVKWEALLDGAAQALGITREAIDVFLDAIPTENKK